MLSLTSPRHTPTLRNRDARIRPESTFSGHTRSVRSTRIAPATACHREHRNFCPPLIFRVGLARHALTYWPLPR
jgi:hypothetical protein